MPGNPRDHTHRRETMVEAQIAARGVRDRRVLDAMRTVPRAAFVADDLDAFAHDDRPLPIGEGQTISQPFIVAAMAAAAELTPTSRVLEIGTGSGYGAAVLGHIATEVWSIERHLPLASDARRRLEDLGFDNVHVIHGDGSLGLAEFAPFDAIVVTAGATRVPPALLAQLETDGRLIIPVGPRRRGQRLLRIRRRGAETIEDDLGAVRFVPLVESGG
jgi:protein-L-isoaspartate(D-aspartate) O-methyltransferase